ncbi:MAG: response regulator [Deltaproteobacteria bacterium]|nr:response regulator [Deltaproteobacteria bacterium]
MRIHVKVFAILVCLVALIILLTVMTSVFFARSGVEETVISQIGVISRLGERLVSDQFDQFRAHTDTMGEHLGHADSAAVPFVLDQELRMYPEFSGAAAFRRGVVVARSGKNPPPASLARDECMRAAASGRRYITTTTFTPGGDLVFYYCTRVNSRLSLAVTIPGLYFSDLLDDFTIWESGSLYILDGEGTVVANMRKGMVLHRYNSTIDPTDSRDVVSSGEHTRRMIKGGSGAGSYYLEGKMRLGVWLPITGNDRGWVFGVSAVLTESPLGHLYRGFILMGITFLGFGVGAAFFSSSFIGRQFDLINRQNEHLAEMNEIAEAASDSKTAFLANMSHEMRTPLNAIVGFSELMLNGTTLPEEREGNMRKIHTAGVTLLGIVNDILDISKIESGKFEMVPVEYDVASVINDTVTVNMIRIGEKDIRFKLSIDPHMPARLRGDELRIKQICNNFLSNAFKYTRQGTVELSVSAAVNGDEVWLMISVRDSGIGIKREDIAKLFSAYNQVDTKSNRLIEGTGLGLSIAKKMAQLMGGTIDVESEYGVGSTFTATVRQAWVSEDVMSEEERKALEGFRFTAKRAAMGSRLALRPLPYARVLIVDDVQTNLDVARGMLKPYGMKIDCVTSGAKSVSLIRKAAIRYDAVFMDHMMPEMDGMEAVRIIREEIGTDYARQIPIIALTANAIIGNEEMFLANGFQAYLAKPIDMEAVDRVLQKWVRDKAREAEYEAAKAEEEKAAGCRGATCDYFPPGSDGHGTREAGDAGRQAGPPASAPAREAGAAGMPGAGAAGPAGAGAPSPGQGGGAAPAAVPAHGRGTGAASGQSFWLGPDQGAFAASGPASCPDHGSGPAREAAPPQGAELGRVDGLDIETGIGRFGGDFDIYRDTLKSYANNTLGLLDLMESPDPGNLKDYMIRVHGIKSSSYGICAPDLGKAAQELEAAAKSGDLAYIGANNPPFLASARKFITELRAFLGDTGPAGPPLADAPDPDLIRRMVGACRAFDMDGVDRAVEELSHHDYATEPGLVDWIRERVDMMELDQIVERFGDAG